ncbi:MAG: hypothetical protein NPINA01_16750 [Nitrospinaceae bacterium]|nr:MAG: hypothetical protein NPINA01_16750 [Nitrospinaceae bacterium]
MSRQRDGELAWSGIRSVLSNSLKQVAIDPKDSLNLISTRWTLIVGKEIAAVSRVKKISPKTLYIDVIEKEWLPALKALHEQIIGEIRQQTGCGELSRIIFKVVPAPALSRSSAYTPVFKK